MKDEYMFLVQKALYTKEVSNMDTLKLNGVIIDGNKEDLTEFFNLLEHANCYLRIVPKDDFDCNRPFIKEVHDNTKNGLKRFEDD